MFQNLLENLRKFWNVPEPSGKFEKIRGETLRGETLRGETHLGETHKFWREIQIFCEKLWREFKISVKNFGGNSKFL
nr:hypothetical protein M03A1.4 - Caenorhabditis elegans [Caenorhabditis elegans]